MVALSIPDYAERSPDRGAGFGTAGYLVFNSARLGEERTVTYLMTVEDEQDNLIGNAMSKPVHRDLAQCRLMALRSPGRCAP